MSFSGESVSPADVPCLTARSLQLLELLATGNVTLNEAAEQLHISVSTANQHIARAKRALRARTTTAAVVEAARRNLICIDVVR